MFVLLAVGVLLVVFGGVVLLRYPSATGGKVSVAGMEVSSASAGLPLIALGLFAVTLSAGDAAGRLPFRDGSSDTVGRSNGEGGCFADVPAERTETLEAGVGSHDVLVPPQSLDEPFVLHLTNGGEPVGELLMRFFPENNLFKVLEAVEASCEPATGLENASQGGDPRTLQNWDTLELILGERRYAVRFGEDGGELGVNYFREIAP